MLRKASDVRYHDDTQVEEILVKALGLVETLSVPDDLREPVFVQACGLYAQKHLEFEQVQVAVNGLAIPQGRQ